MLIAWVVRAADQGRWSEAEVLHSLPAAERDSLTALTRPADRFRSLLGRSALTQLLMTVGADPLVRRRADGSLECPGGPCVSVSHSGSWAAVAVADAVVGIDVQVHEPPLDDPLVRSRSCTPDELAQKDFHRLWVRKEAVLKTGVVSEMRDLDVRADLVRGRRVLDLPLASALRGAVATLSSAELELTVF